MSLPVAIVHSRKFVFYRIAAWLKRRELNPVCATCQSSLHYGSDMHQPAWMPYGQVCQGFGADRVVHMKYDRPRPPPRSMPGPIEGRRM